MSTRAKRKLPGLVILEEEPIELAEGKSRTYELEEYMLEDDCSHYSELGPDNCVACVVDATGRCYWSHGFLNRLIKGYIADSYAARRRGSQSLKWVRQRSQS
ncbi:hypothetical protein HKBW3S03_01219 [Candidatus Hakubella thermalkaliphila]|uniref:Uncharacterized protein n=1 Tax=Candidatus Hakubella thermalkaliphila TaxID=2754717 RepID=A0A6V8PYQ1_9ACTN|nr:hypothetical protein [Bacillota bacterium]GFP19714.1 hypothetical protein HKBW3S03_01219 [Candidatus Hakubella thermalkaliphila]GFP31081.1 hypothetical protein HKBW3S34_02000 [Candidatus Hakubella thermalkaliphila]GFP37655.1 hypothetical protein HKBW3S44_01332 [Candidatus Hakubella thermalkaliphila]GFP40160.1 hypothetical protein HKBW3S47_01857 [Candidatus Hakubella thermalkaliphila]